MKYFVVCCLISLGISAGGVFAQNLEIIPQGNDQTVADSVTAVGAQGGNVRKNYNDQAQKLQTLAKKDPSALGSQMASGIFTWDTLLDYLVYLVRFLSQIGIFIGAVMILYAGYLYATSVFSDKGPAGGKTAIKNAIIGVIVITFSYAIMKAITAAFLT